MKKKLFILITILAIPIFIFVFFEIVLRIIGFGDAYQLFLEKDNYYYTNQSFPHKYFTSKDISIPEVIDQKFPLNKGANTFRIVTLGGSTTAGFPYEININWPFFIKHYLSKSQKLKQIELINLGISAINSHALLDILKQVYKVEPDLILIYVGHNEFYGAMGVASTQYIGGSRSFIKLVLRLKDFRIYQAIEYFISSFGSTSSRNLSKKSLMNQMIGKTNLSRNDALYKKTIDNFALNLEEIIDSINRKDIPVIISTLVSNLSDQYPLGESPELKKNQKVNRLYEDALQIEKSHPEESLKLYNQILEEPLEIAEIYFRLGKVFLVLGEVDSAIVMFQKACDLDLMPFRAPSEMNEIIIFTAKAHATPLADSKKLFFEYAQNRIPGNELFLEHLHPNQKGYAIIALAFLVEIHNKKFIEFKIPDNLDSFVDQMPFTSLDTRIGEIKINNLIDDFPFNGRSAFLTDTNYLPIVDSISREHVFEGLFWDAAHFRLGDYFFTLKREKRAVKEYNAVLTNDPTNTSALYKLGDLYSSNEQWEKAIDYYNRAIEISPTAAYLYAKLGKALMISGQTGAALTSLEQVVHFESNRKTLNDADMQLLYYLLAVGYTRNQLWSKANAAVNMSLNYDKNYSPSLLLKNEIIQRRE